MNERIRECADGAGLDSNWKPGFNSIYGQQLEKFAQLIIQECAKHITTTKIEAMPPDDKAIKVLIDVLVKDMKDYFGVDQ